jgi:cell division protease FtsH
MNTTWRNILIFVGSLTLVGMFLVFVNVEDIPKLNLSALATEIEQGNVKSIVVRGTEVSIVRADDSKANAQKESGESLSELLQNYGVAADKIRAVPIEVQEGTGLNYWLRAILPTLIPLLLIFALIWLFLRQVQGQNNRALMFGQSGAREIDADTKKETFADVAGVKEAKEELSEIVEFLKHPEKFVALGAKIPKGVLLMGSPGTGKTLLARAVAGEAGVPFFHMSGSEFVEMLVGVGASRVRDLFSKAKKRTPCIVFIDEIDAVGRQRGTGLGGSHDEREQTLNQILVEMDGFEPNLGIIVVAATNRPDVLDPALLRPGRFDRRVVLDLPDIKERHEILTVHARNKPLAPDVVLRQLAERTPGFSGADLANLINEAAILAARRDKKQVEMVDLLESIEKVLLGPERKNRMFKDEERKITAVHEAGHALVTHLQPHTDPVQKISIISRGHAAGYTLKMPLEDRLMRRREEYMEDIAILLGGFAAEQIFFGDITTGASDDMKQATRLVRHMVTQWGMSETLGPRTYGEQDELIFLGREIHENRNYSEDVARKIDEEMDKLIAAGLKKAREIVQGNKTVIDKVASVLLEKETLERKEFYDIVGLPPANAQNLIPPVVAT